MEFLCVLIEYCKKGEGVRANLSPLLVHEKVASRCLENKLVGEKIESSDKAVGGHIKNCALVIGSKTAYVTKIAGELDQSEAEVENEKFFAADHQYVLPSDVDDFDFGTKNTTVLVASGLLQRRFDGENPHILGVLDLQNMLIGQIVLLLYVCLHSWYFEGRHLQFFVYNVLSVGLGRNELTFRHKTRRDDPLFLFVASIFAVDYCLGRFDQ